MLKRIYYLLAGVAMMATATGCCCLGGCLGGYNRCSPCGPTYGASQCGPGGCAPTYGYPAGYLPGDTSQAFAPTYQMSAAPPIIGQAYPTTVYAQTLPTY